jgi:CBS-domain-containing membrane protein
MKVKDIMTWPVFSIAPESNVLPAVQMMLKQKISGLPVVDADGKLLGIVTEGDFLRRAETATERRRPRWLQFLVGPGRLADEYVHTHTRKIADVMTTEPITVNENTPIEEVVHLMEKHRIKRLPVVRERQLVGIVSRANLLHALASLAPTVPATTASDETIRKNLLAELERQKWAPVGFLNVVVRDGIVQLWGTITDERERQALVVAAQNIPGVKNVQDHLVWVEPMSGVVIGAGGEVLAP